MALVQSLWIGDHLVPMQQLSIASFLRCGHDYHLYTYGPVSGVPPGTTVCDAETILPKNRIFRHQEGFGKGSCSAFSDLFRYSLVFESGGWWVDTDLVCLGDFEFDDSFVFATEIEDDGTLLTATCAFKAPAGSGCLRHCLDVCATKDPSAIQWSEIGPYLFDNAVKQFGLAKYQVNSAVFNPINYCDFRDIVAPGFDMRRIDGSAAVHLWNQMWAAHGIDIDGQAQPGSLYDALRSRYSPRL
jgi:hypothetical protein